MRGRRLYITLLFTSHTRRPYTQAIVRNVLRRLPSVDAHEEVPVARPAAADLQELRQRQSVSAILQQRDFVRTLERSIRTSAQQSADYRTRTGRMARQATPAPVATSARAASPSVARSTREERTQERTLPSDVELTRATVQV